jgi:hypothetical protein
MMTNAMGWMAGENWVAEMANHAMSIWIQFIATIEQQGKQRRKINSGRNIIATQTDRNNKQIMCQTQKCIAVE